MSEARLLGDEDGQCMAAPPSAAAALTALIPPGPVLELCCGLGGLTRALAREHRVLAVDRDPGRLAWAGRNLHAAGVGGKVDLLCCDLTRPALRPTTRAQFSACVLDPDWSAPGRPPSDWAGRLEDMEPPALELARWAMDFSPRLALRLPPGAWEEQCRALGKSRTLSMTIQGRVRFCFVLWGQWGGDSLGAAF